MKSPITQTPAQGGEIYGKIMKYFYVYILATKNNGTFYVGMTANLSRRMLEHREGAISGFTKRYGICRLVYAEKFECRNLALRRERRLKRWPRHWKMLLIEQLNPCWNDLFEKDFTF